VRYNKFATSAFGKYYYRLLFGLDVHLHHSEYLTGIFHCCGVKNNVMNEVGGLRSSKGTGSRIFGLVEVELRNKI
jgi:hypothetical protein